MSDLYSQVVMDHFYAPRNGFRMQDPDRVGQAGTPAQGPFVVLYLRLAGERISQASFQTFGCAPAIAAGSLLCERLSGATLADAAAWTEEALNEALGGLPNHKRICTELTIAALNDALLGTGTRTTSGADTSRASLPSS